MSVKRGSISFEAGGKSLAIAMTTNAMCMYQDAAGETLLTGLAALQADPSDIRRVRRMFWAGLSHAVAVTEAEAGDIMDEVGVAEAVSLLSRAATAAFPAAEPGNAAPVTKPRKVQTS